MATKSLVKPERIPTSHIAVGIPPDIWAEIVVIARRELTKPDVLLREWLEQMLGRR